MENTVTTPTTDTNKKVVLLPATSTSSNVVFKLFTVFEEIDPSKGFGDSLSYCILDEDNNQVSVDKLMDNINSVTPDKLKTVTIKGKVYDVADLAMDSFTHSLSKVSSMLPMLKISNTSGDTTFVNEALVANVTKAAIVTREGVLKGVLKSLIKFKINITSMLPLALAAQKHLLISGKAGHGKTYEVTKWAATTGRKVLQVTMHPGVEATDVLGAPTIAMDKSLVWVDGTLARAFRLARSGEKVVLIVDEILRMPARELSIFVGALTPDATGHYRLNTGKVLTDSDGKIVLFDGAAETEELTCPRENLFVVATTNKGADYDVADGDTAFNDRFLHYYHELSETQLEEIVEHELQAKFGNKAKAKAVAKSLTKINAKYNELCRDGDLAGILTLRHISEAILAATDYHELNLHISLKFPLLATATTEGRPDPVQIQKLTAILNKFLA